MTVTLGSYFQQNFSVNCQRLATRYFKIFSSVYLCPVSPNVHLPIFLPLSLIVQRQFTFFASCRVIKSDLCRHVSEDWSVFPFFSKLSRNSGRVKPPVPPKYRNFLSGSSSGIHHGVKMPPLNNTSASGHRATVNQV